jgi:integrase
MTEHIHKISVRKGLPPRREPYWTRISDGQYLGYRKLETGGTWIARQRNDAGKQEYNSLGEESPTFSFDEAREAAVAWFGLSRGAVRDDSEKPETVGDACKRYVTWLRDEDNRPSAAHQTDVRFQKTVYGVRDKKKPTEWKHKPKPLALVRLEKLVERDITKWRASLPGAPGTKNRVLIMLRAALNRAVIERAVSAAQAIEWHGKTVKNLTGGRNRRGLFLDIDQRRALIAAVESPACRDMVQAVALTGMRPGEELTSLRRRDFDARTSTLYIGGLDQNDEHKTGSRAIPLSLEAVALFERLAKDKLPNAYLFVRDDGLPWNHSDWDELIRDAAKKAGLPCEPKQGVCMYTLRHSWITEVLTEGWLSILEVARITGTSVQMIEKHYGHLTAKGSRKRIAEMRML